MKKVLSLAVFTLSLLAAKAQVTVTSVNEDFNTNNACTQAGQIYPVNWFEYDVAGLGPTTWTCTPTGGRYNTPGIYCTGYTNGSNTTDTAWLLTPRLNLSGYANNVYMNYDTKTDHIHLGEKMSIYVLVPTPDSFIYNGGKPDTTPLQRTNMTNAMNPIFSDNDSTGWVTHQINLTPYKSAPFYVAFVYTSAAADVPTSWTLDNINTTPFALNVNNTVKNNATIPINIINTSASSLEISCDVTTPGKYQVIVYDMLGRTAYKDELTLEMGISTHVINGLNLQHDAMYFVRVGDSQSYGTTKVVVH
jgi:hypothetical protein